MRHTRRKFLALGMAGVSVFAGCSSRPDEESDPNTTSTPTTTPTNSPTELSTTTITTTSAPTEVRTTTASESPTATLTDTSNPTATSTTSPTETPTPTQTETLTSTPTATPTPEPPDQPKIREVQDNFGHTFEVTNDHDEQFTVEEEIVVDNDTTVELCVTEINKQSDNEIRMTTGSDIPGLNTQIVRKDGYAMIVGRGT